MKVYVVTTGVAAYEDNVCVIGVFKTKEEAVNRGKLEADYTKLDATYGNYWYDVEEFNLE